MAPAPGRPAAASVTFLLSVVGVLLVGLAVSLAPWNHVFVSERVRIQGTDSFYHVLRVQRIVADYPHVAWHDPMMNYPEGATIPWPPLFDQLIATLAVVAGGTEGQPEVVETVAALVPPLLGVMTVLLVAAIGTLLVGRWGGVVAALVVALLPAHILYREVGRPDQHIAESFLFCWIAWAFLTGGPLGGESGRRRWLAASLLGLGIALAFWNWMGSGLYLVFLLAFTALWHLLAPPRDQAAARNAWLLGVGGALAVVLLILSMLLWAPPGALTEWSLLGLTGFHVALVALTAGFGGLLVGTTRLFRRETRANRLLQIVLAGGVPLAIMLVLVRGFRDGVAHALVFAGRANPWYQIISEFQPVFFSGMLPLRMEVSLAAEFYGLGLIAMPLVLIPLVRTWRRRPDERPGLAFLLFWGLAFLLLALSRRRFDNYFAVPLGLWLAVGWQAVGDALSRRWGRRPIAYALAFGLLAVVMLPALQSLVSKVQRPPVTRAELLGTLEWLRAEPPLPGREAVLAGWDLGHYIEYVANKPVLANPFGTDLGSGPMEDAAAVFLAQQEEAAADVLARRRIGFLLLKDPTLDTIAFFGFAPPGTAPAVKVTPSWREGRGGEITEAFWNLIVSRLYFLDGLSRRPGHTLDGYRLLYESPSTVRSWAGWSAKQYKVFGVVPGVEVVLHSAPGRTVTAGVQLATNQGRAVDWVTSKVADANGHVTIRLPYATGRNGAVAARGPYRIADGVQELRLTVAEEQVQAGETVNLARCGGHPATR